MEKVSLIVDGLSPAQHNVLLELKRRGEASADSLAGELGTSASAVRQHLTGLRSAGYVATRQERGRPGRPVDLYHSTEMGDALFAGPSDTLMVELLEHIEAEDPDVVTRAFDQRQHRRAVDVAARLPDSSVQDRVEALVEILDAEGYLANYELKDDGAYVIVLHNCAIWAVATRYGQACSTELEFLQEVLPGCEVSRVMHRGDGSFACGYQIRPVESAVP